tara:strand:+ start:857 stop:970 length:114 start_codon:yes stop_codon:yes gene_type:complete
MSESVATRKVSRKLLQQVRAGEVKAAHDLRKTQLKIA